MIVRLGETYIPGHDKKMAADLMRACEALGFHPIAIKTTDSGFVVPNEVAEEVERMNVPAWAGEKAVF